jgi:N-acetylglucosamine-6-sulfatase
MRPLRRTRLTAVAALAAVTTAVLASCGTEDERVVRGPDPLEASRSAEKSGKPSDPPNVVVIMTDDQREESVRGMATVKRQLKQKGTTFTKFLATYPLCCPSRATFLTGQYAHNHGVVDNVPPDGGYAALDGSETLPVAMERGGYRTAHVGKYLNQYGHSKHGNPPEEIPPGWTRWYSPVEKTAGRMFGYLMNENGELKQYGNKARHYQTDVYARFAKRFIRRSAEQSRPFFLSVATLAPHGEGQRSGKTPNPRPAPRHEGAFRDERLPKAPSFNEEDTSDKPEYVRSRSRAGRDGQSDLKQKHRDRLTSLLAVDGLVKKVISELRKEGELRNTLIIFTSDNGYLLGEHRLKEKKRLLYSESVQVPLMMRGPGIPEGEKRDQVTGNIDLAPTIGDFTRVPLILESDGRSLLDLAADERVASERDILLQNDESRAIRTPRYLYAEHESGERELYDLKKDPYELESRHAGGPNARDEAAAIEARLREKLRRLVECQGAECG